MFMEIYLTAFDHPKVYDIRVFPDGRWNTVMKWELQMRDLMQVVIEQDGYWPNPAQHATISHLSQAYGKPRTFIYQPEGGGFFFIGRATEAP